ncbi:MAG: hypothetical protein IPO92_14870 [Saprospiraceae bacterium]|nr:hypothetical protein [Saprospiraceae bacterium]
MSSEMLKPYHLFDDLAEKQRVIKANSKKVTLEEARALTRWIKDGKADKKQRPNAIMNDESRTINDE